MSLPEKIDIGLAQVVVEAEKSVFRALQLFREHFRQTAGLMVAIFAVVLGALVLAARLGDQLTVEARVVAAALLVLEAPLAAISIQVISRYYRLYVAAQRHLRALHSELKILPNGALHPWLQDADDSGRVWSKAHSLRWCAVLLGAIGGGSAVTGLWMFL